MSQKQAQRRIGPANIKERAERDDSCPFDPASPLNIRFHPAELRMMRLLDHLVERMIDLGPGLSEIEMADIDIEVSVFPDRHILQIAITQGDRARRETRMVFLADEIDVLIAALIAKRADMLPPPEARPAPRPVRH